MKSQQQQLQKKTKSCGKHVWGLLFILLAIIIVIIIIVLACLLHKKEQDEKNTHSPTPMY